MKKITIIGLIAVMLLISLTACSSSKKTIDKEKQEDLPPEPPAIDQGTAGEVAQQEVGETVNPDNVEQVSQEVNTDEVDQLLNDADLDNW